MARTDPSTFDRIASPYDRGMAPLEKLLLQRMRQHLLANVQGKVLEIGVGTGANFPFYPDSIDLTAVDESDDMLGIAARRAQVLDRNVRLSQADVEYLSFPSGSFDYVVASLVLCSVVNQQRALTELRRVLKRPGGQLLLLEHMRPSHSSLGRLFDLADIPWFSFNGRCHLNRETEHNIGKAGFSVNRVESRLGGFLRLVVATAR